MSRRSDHLKSARVALVAGRRRPVQWPGSALPVPARGPPALLNRRAQQQPGRYCTLVSPTAQAAIGIVGFFACALLIARTLRPIGIVLLAIIAAALLAAALVLQAVIDDSWPAYAALGLAVLVPVVGFALEAAEWRADGGGFVRKERRSSRARDRR